MQVSWIKVSQLDRPLRYHSLPSRVGIFRLHIEWPVSASRIIDWVANKLPQEVLGKTFRRDSISARLLTMAEGGRGFEWIAEAEYEGASDGHV